MSGARQEIAGTSRLFGRRLAAPGLGLLVALTSVSALLFMPSGPRADRSGSFGMPRVGTAVVFERDSPAPGTTDASRPDDPRMIVRL